MKLTQKDWSYIDLKNRQIDLPMKNQEKNSENIIKELNLKWTVDKEWGKTVKYC